MSEKNFLRRWLDGQVDWSAMLEQEKAPKKEPAAPYEPHYDPAAARESLERGQIAYTPISLVRSVMDIIMVFATQMAEIRTAIPPSAPSIP